MSHVRLKTALGRLSTALRHAPAWDAPRQRELLIALGDIVTGLLDQDDDGPALGVDYEPPDDLLRALAGWMVATGDPNHAVGSFRAFYAAHARPADLPDLEPNWTTWTDPPG